MPSQNLYPGYIRVPKKKPFQTALGLDFNGIINSQPGGTKLEGFTLRLYVPRKSSRSRAKDEYPEMSVTLRPEEWLDLVDSMREAFESVSAARKEFDDSQ